MPLLQIWDKINDVNRACYVMEKNINTKFKFRGYAHLYQGIDTMYIYFGKCHNYRIKIIIQGNDMYKKNYVKVFRYAYAHNQTAKIYLSGVFSSPDKSSRTTNYIINIRSIELVSK